MCTAVYTWVLSMLVSDNAAHYVEKDKTNLRHDIMISSHGAGACCHPRLEIMRTHGSGLSSSHGVTSTSTRRLQIMVPTFTHVDCHANLVKQMDLT